MITPDHDFSEYADDDLDWQEPDSQDPSDSLEQELEELVGWLHSYRPWVLLGVGLGLVGCCAWGVVL